MKGHLNQSKRYFCFLFLLFSTFGISLQAQIVYGEDQDGSFVLSGPVSGIVNDQAYIYTVEDEDENDMYIEWEVEYGSIAEANGRYEHEDDYDTEGSITVTWDEGYTHHEISAQIEDDYGDYYYVELDVTTTLSEPPAIPSMPTITNYPGYTVLARANPPSGETWYWQSSATGTSTANSSVSVTRTTGTVYYLRSKDTASGLWSTARTISYTIDPDTLEVPALPTITNNCGATVLTRGTPPSGETWYWQSSATGTSTSNSNISVTRTSGTVYYLRSKSNTSSLWSASRVVNYTITQPTNWYIDSDGDGFGDASSSPESSCTAITGKVENNSDNCPDFPSVVNNGCPVGEIYENRHWTQSEAYDINGSLKAKSKSYFDDLGKAIQTQTVDIKTNKTWASQTMYDAQGRPALQTLSSPVYRAAGSFLYKDGFIKKSSGADYTSSDFEANPENPNPVGTTANTLGHYYSSSNVDPVGVDKNLKGNNYQDATQYPFSRTVYSELNPGVALRVLGGNKVDHDNDPTTADIWLNGYTFSMPAGNELSQTDAFNDTKYDAIQTIKTVSRDAHGVEAVVFTDTDGRTLAAARSGGSTSRDMSIAISDQGYVDLHVPDSITGFTINGVSGITTEVYDLITEQIVTSATSSLPNGFYRISITNLNGYDAETTPVTISYKENYYDYSLNEYDEAGRLLASYQPLKKLKSEFKYNALGQLTYSKSPDEGEAWFKYRKDGQIRFSQNSKQKDPNADGNFNDQEFSYTNYDTYGRPIESGVVSGLTFNTNLNPDAPLTGGTKKEQQFTTYDGLETSDQTFLNALHADYHTPSFLAGNVAKTSNAYTTTYYNYDAYGRVKWMVQDINGLGTKTIDYKYDPITGNVLEVDYQKHIASERFVHKYTYNVVDELIKVETSTDGTTFIEQAEYFYYETGALRRVELAENLQGIDYVYNLAGQLKAINHPSGDTAKDPGKDGHTDSANSGFTADVFSMSLDYYKGDYTRTGTPTPINAVTNGEDQFNGNIKAMTWRTNHPTTTPTTETYYYGYNKNNWLESAGLNAPINGTGADTGDYNVSNIKYDANGNIQSLYRNKQSENGNSSAMDQLSYEYYDDPNATHYAPNQLKRVDDAAGEVAGADDIGDQDGDNYTYNSIGQLIENVGEQVKYFYNASGLVTEVQKNNVPLVKFFYNDKGHRVRKEVYNTGGTLTATDYYVRDASGSVMAIYNNSTLTEQPIYGQNRLGVHYRVANKDRYQLTDHLGNVRAVVERSNSIPLSATDYYPFGMPMPNRQIVGGEPYRYAFQGQEKDAETGKEAFQLRLWDSRIGRWLTTDPAGQYSSPYLGMGNNPINGIDPDGGKFFDWIKNLKTGEVKWFDGTGAEAEAAANLYWNFEINDTENIQNLGTSFFGPISSDNFFDKIQVLNEQELYISQVSNRINQKAGISFNDISKPNIAQEYLHDTFISSQFRFGSNNGNNSNLVDEELIGLIWDFGGADFVEKRIPGNVISTFLLKSVDTYFSSQTTNQGTDPNIPKRRNAIREFNSNTIKFINYETIYNIIQHRY